MRRVTRIGARIGALLRIMMALVLIVAIVVMSGQIASVFAISVITC